MAIRAEVDSFENILVHGRRLCNLLARQAKKLTESKLPIRESCAVEKSVKSSIKKTVQPEKSL
jgi:hypothetical protein